MAGALRMTAENLVVVNPLSLARQLAGATRPLCLDVETDELSSVTLRLLPPKEQDASSETESEAST